MRLSKLSPMCWVLLCTTVFAQLVDAIEITDPLFLFAGEDFEITWGMAEGRVHIGLLKGPSDDLERVGLIASMERQLFTP